MNDSGPGLPVISGEELRQLDGAHWRIQGTDYTISSGRSGLDRGSMAGGGESRIIPLLDETGQVTSCFSTNVRSISSRRVRRIQWLAEQRLWDWSPGLIGAPRLWIDTRECGRPDGCRRDFAGYLMAAAPGTSWASFKFDIQDAQATIREEWRYRWVNQFLRTLAVLETHNLVHGDLSPGNVMVSAEEPVQLSLIDFDTFVAADAGDELSRLTNVDGGMLGTAGYLPIDLEKQRGHSASVLAPYSDRRARDMLLLELLCFDSRCDDEDPVSMWDWSLIDDTLDRRKLGQAERYLHRPEIIDLPEAKRVTSTALARAMNISLSPSVKRRYHTSLPDAAASPGKTGQSNPFPQWTYCMTVWPDRTASLVRSSLWSLCVAEWLLLSLIVPDCIITTEGEQGLLLWFMQSGVQLFVGAAIFATGLWRTTVVAFGSETPTIWHVGSVQFLIPETPVTAHSHRGWRQSPLARLCFSAFLLASTVCFLVKR